MTVPTRMLPRLRDLAGYFRIFVFPALLLLLTRRLICPRMSTSSSWMNSNSSSMDPVVSTTKAISMLSLFASFLALSLSLWVVFLFLGIVSVHSWSSSSITLITTECDTREPEGEAYSRNTGTCLSSSACWPAKVSAGGRKKTTWPLWSVTVTSGPRSVQLASSFSGRSRRVTRASGMGLLSPSRMVRRSLLEKEIPHFCWC
mmetsp:Transcript_17636/g.34254  ORF Transcript_17636/g.34254 Transcript_17636/m.34254 type:complete len:202 (-) Transcript_17636:339-944(-)